jgi:amidophosphoribosyltransferase
MTNVSELFQNLVELGQYPVQTSDTVTILEKIGHFLDEANEAIYRKFKEKGLEKKDISPLIAQNLNVQSILSRASKRWDGGYAIVGMFGHGDAFVMRDPSGIRPVYYYHDDEVIVATSERPAIQTTFNVNFESVKELSPGNALIIKKDGTFGESEFRAPEALKACSFERIYFSRGTDKEIYTERKNLGKHLVPTILESINYDIENTVFSYIPNTAAVAFYGLLEELGDFCSKVQKEKILAIRNEITEEKLEEILAIRPRTEKVAVKDAALRTFITNDIQRDDLVAHVYDVTYGTIRKGIDSLVVIDDSIVRGTTLKQSILRILARLEPKRIIVASSAPQIRYPDCYGIDMARLSDFVAFNAAIELLHQTGQTHIINTVYKKCKESLDQKGVQAVNHVKAIYKPFSALQLSEKISELLTPKGIKPKIQIIYQRIEDLHEACPANLGDWYFTGDYPTPGGNQVANRSFINFIEGKYERAY